MKREILLLCVSFLFFIGNLGCARYSETRNNLKNFEARQQEITSKIKPQKTHSENLKKKKKLEKKYKRRHAPQAYLPQTQSSLQGKEEDIPIAPEPIEPLEGENSSKKKLKKKKLSPWLHHIIRGGLSYKEVAQEALSIRLLDLSEIYSKRSIFFIQKAETLLEVDATEAMVYLQTWLDELELPKIAIKKKSYYRAQDAFESIQHSIQKIESYSRKLCAYSEGVDFFSAQAHLDYSIALLEKKLYEESILQSRKALNYLGNRNPEDLKCDDVDKDRILIPFDQCPYAPEDRDGDEDGDGCPEFDVEFG